MDGYCRRPFRAVCAALAVLLLFSSVTAAWAQEARSGARVMEWYVTGDSVLVYVQHSGEGQSAEARVGTEGAGNAVITGTDGDVPVVTWLLVDNSLSIVKEDRAKLKQLLTDVVAGSASGERFNLCTFNTGLNVILQDSRDYVELKGKIEAIEHVDQDAFLVDALAEILDAESGRESQEFVRIVVISDGMDVNPEGLTKDELTQRLRDRNVPIYTLGCKRNGNEQALKEMYSLSRMTNAQSWPLTGLEDTLTIAQALNSAELPVCAQVTIPEVMRDGSSRGVQLTFNDGAVAELTAAMPFGSITPTETPVPEPTPAPTPEPAPAPTPAPEPEPSPVLKVLPWIVLAAAVLAAAGAAVFFLIRRKREAERIKPVTEGEPFDEAAAEPDMGDFEAEDGGTILLVTNDRRLTLCLTDRKNPGRHFEVPLRGKVTIGRVSGNQIVLDYDKSVSSRHCEIYQDGPVFRIRDLKSMNGTYVDGLQVIDVAEISNGSTLKLGRLELLVEIR